jgi:hypothetical protein
MADKRIENAGRDTNPDPITGSPGSHPVATGVGAAAAGAAGAAIGSIVPGIGTVIGGVVGAVAGAVGGGYAGKAVGEMIDPTGTDDYWREKHPGREYANGAPYEEYAPAYQYGAAISEESESLDYDESRVRAGWDTTPHASKLHFDKASPAIREEFNRRMGMRAAQKQMDK